MMARAPRNAKRSGSRPTTAKSAPLKALAPMIDSRRLAARVRELAHIVAESIDPDERPLAVVVLQGAFVFAADLLRALPRGYPIDVAFVRCQSYGSGMVSSGRVMLLHDIDLDMDLRGRTVILIDDILDTGLTLEFLTDHVKRRGAARVAVCTLLARRGKKCAVRVDWTGFKIGSQFVVGYGLDFDGQYRQLPYITALPRKA
jgi:hypoxanthine phosphoribosyltransferase